MRSILALLVVISLMHTVAYAQQASVRSELSASTITRDETVTLTIIAVGLDKELDISSLDKDFDVIGRSSSRQISTVTGSNNQPTTTSVVTWALELMPRDVGVFTVPAVTVGGIPSQLLTLTVNDIPSGAKRDVFVEVSVDTQTPWVQSQVIMTLRVFQAVDIVDGGLDVPAGDNLVVERIGEDTRSNELRDGRQYSVTERRFALFAQKSGPLTIEPITLSVSVPADPSRVRGFFSPTRRVTRRTEPVTLDVQARPPSGAAWWLPARAVELNSQWAGDALNAQVDTPLTRTITLRASGVLDSQLPDINIPAIEGASLYAEEPQRAMGANEAGLVAEQVINWAIIPQRVGQLKLPAVSVEWFDTQTGQRQTAQLPEETINVVASPSASSGQSASQPTPPADSTAPDDLDNVNQLALGDSAQTPATPSGPAQRIESGSASTELSATIAEPSHGAIATLEQSVRLWRTVALAVLTLWLLSCMFYWLYRRRNTAGGSVITQANSGNASISAARSKAHTVLNKLAPLSAVEAGCKASEPTALQEALIDWASRQWPEQPPQTLNSLARRLPNGEARNQIRALDAARYSRQSSPADKQAIMTQMVTLPEHLKLAVAEGLAADNDRNGGRIHPTPHGLPEL